MKLRKNSWVARGNRTLANGTTTIKVDFLKLKQKLKIHVILKINISI